MAGKGAAPDFVGSMWLWLRLFTSLWPCVSGPSLAQWACCLWTFPTGQVKSHRGKGFCKASKVLQMQYTNTNSTSSHFYTCSIYSYEDRSITFIIRELKIKSRWNNTSSSLGRQKSENLESASKGGINRQIMHYWWEGKLVQHLWVATWQYLLNYKLPYFLTQKFQL